MRVNWNKIILILTLILIGGLFYSANTINSKRTIKNIIIEFESSDKLFITKDSILKLIPKEYPNKNSVDMNHIESVINSNGFIKKSEAYVSIDGTLIIELMQRNPIGRIIDDNSTFYIDDQSKIMRTSKLYSSNVPVIFNFSESFNYDRIYKVCDLVYNDEFLKKNVTQINFLKNDNIILNFRKYDFDLIIGEYKNISKKIKNFKAFYNRSVQNETLKKYSKINLQFENQVVCSNK